MVMHTYNPSTQEVEAGGPQVVGQPGLQSKTCHKQTTNKPEQQAEKVSSRLGLGYAVFAKGFDTWEGTQKEINSKGQMVSTPPTHQHR